jgi:hypothetical protein
VAHRTRLGNQEHPLVHETPVSLLGKMWLICGPGGIQQRMAHLMCEDLTQAGVGKSLGTRVEDDMARVRRDGVYRSGLLNSIVTVSVDCISCSGYDLS